MNNYAVNVGRKGPQKPKIGSLKQQQVHLGQLEGFLFIISSEHLYVIHINDTTRRSVIYNFL